MAWLSGYGSGLGYRKKYTIDHTVPTSSLSNFSKLIKVTSDANFGTHCDTSGNSLRVTTSDGTTLLDFGIVSFGISGGLATFILRVNIPTISNSVDVDIYVYYKSSGSSGQNKAGAIDSNTTLYCPLEEDPAGSAPQMFDWSSNAYHGTATGGGASPTSVAATVGNGMRCDSQNFTDHGRVIQLDGATKCTLSGIISRPAGVTITGFGRDAGVSTRVLISWYSDSNVYFCLDDGVGGISGQVGLSGTAAHLFHLVFDGSLSGSSNQLKGYVDGVAQTLSGLGTVPATIPSNAATFKICRVNNGGSAGQYDEITLATGVARTPEYIAYEFTDQTSNSSTFTLGAEETDNITPVFKSLLAFWAGGAVAYGQIGSSITLTGNIDALGTLGSILNRNISNGSINSGQSILDGRLSLNRQLLSILDGQGTINGYLRNAISVKSSLDVQSILGGLPLVSMSGSGLINNNGDLSSAINLSRQIQTTLSGTSFLGAEGKLAIGSIGGLSGSSTLDDIVRVARQLRGQIDGLSTLLADLSIAHSGIQVLLGILSGQSDLGSICRVGMSAISSTGGTSDLSSNIGIGRGLLGIVGTNGELLTSPIRIASGITGPISGQGDLQGRLNMSFLIRTLLDGSSSFDNGQLAIARGIRSQIDGLGLLTANPTRTYSIASTIGTNSIFGNANLANGIGFSGSTGSNSGISVGVLVNRGLRTQLVGISELIALLNLVQNPLNIEIVRFILSIKTQHEMDLFVKTAKEFTLER